MKIFYLRLTMLLYVSAMLSMIATFSMEIIPSLKRIDDESVDIEVDNALLLIEKYKNEIKKIEEEKEKANSNAQRKLEQLEEILVDRIIGLRLAMANTPRVEREKIIEDRREKLSKKISDKKEEINDTLERLINQLRQAQDVLQKNIEVQQRVIKEATVERQRESEVQTVMKEKVIVRQSINKTNEQGLLNERELLKNRSKKILLFSALVLGMGGIAGLLFYYYLKTKK